MEFPNNTGKFLIVIGIILIVTGLLLMILGNKPGWLGNLPGDIRIEKPNFRFYFPVTSLIIISIVLNLIFWLIRKLH